MVNSIAMTWDVNKRHKGHKIRAKTKMLTRQQKAIIRYCFTEGIPARDLAEKYARSPTRIDQIQWEPEFKIFGTDDEKSWFLAGVEAAISVQRAKMVVPEPANRLLQAREACRKVRQDLYSRRAKNLPNFAQQDRQIREEGIAEEEDIAEEEGIAEDDDSGDANQAVARETVSRLIIENMLQNLSGRRRRYHPMCVKFCYILRSYSAVCYDYMRKILPLPSRQTITAKFKDVERRLARSYQCPGDLDYVISSYFDRHPLPQMNKPLTCTVSIDAFSISVFRKTRWEESVPEKRIHSSRLPEKSKLEIELEQVPEQAVVPRLITETYNNVFLVMLNPLDWSHPPALLSAFCWRNGHADRNIVRCILELIESLKKYNIEVCAIASDGDPGYNCLHDAFAKLWRKKKNDDFFVIFNRVFSKPSKVRIEQACIASRAAPIADPLHALKIARSRILDHVVFLARNVKVSDMSLKCFRDKDWFKDRSQLAKLSDYYAISMFDAETLLSLCEEGEFAAAIYLWPWVSLCLVIRLPSLSLDCRRSLLHGTFTIMQFFYNQDLRASFGEARVTARAMRGCDGVSFFEPSYLVRVLHLILCLYHVLLNHNERLRMSALGSHINENVIGRIRVASHGNPRYEIVQRAVSKAEVRRLLQAELGAEHTVRCRDNVGGTKLDSGVSCDLEGPDFAENAKLLIKCLEEWSNEKAEAALIEICQFLRTVTDLPKESCQIYRPNDAANSGIISRLMKFV